MMPTHGPTRWPQTGLRHRLRRLWALPLAGLCACSAVRATYVQPGYSVHGPAPIKHVAVASWAPPEAQGLGQVLTAVAADLIKLRKNYVVLDTAPGTLQGVQQACTGAIEGVMLVRALEVAGPERGTLQLRAALELYRCRDGALVFRREGQRRGRCHDAHLEDLTASYELTLGPPSRAYVAPAFSLLQALVEGLPNPELTDAEIEEKIELGGLVSPREGVAPLAQLGKSAH